MSDILEQIEEIQSNVREIMSTWGNTIMTLDNIKTGFKAGREKAIEEAYQKGLQEGEGRKRRRHDHDEQLIEQGRNEAWEAARKITHMQHEDRMECFGLVRVYSDLTASEAIAKLAAYEEKKKADSEIKVGDEVTYTFKDGTEIVPFVVFKINDDGGNRICEGHQVTDGIWVGGGLDYKKTGRHFPEVAQMLKKMKEGE